MDGGALGAARRAPPAAAWLAERFELGRGGSGQNLRPMEGLRGLAVLLVFVVHYVSLLTPWLAPHATGGLFAGARTLGYAGVDLFFVLSGYLIYGTLIARAQRFGRYFARRLQRIYPAFLAVFVVYLGLALAGAGQGRLPDRGLALYLVENLLLLPGLLPIVPLITVAWSLSYEMFFYLAAPALIAALGLRRWSRAQRVLLLGALGVALTAWCALRAGPVQLALFLVGAALYELRTAASPPRAPIFASVAAAVAAGAVVVALGMSDAVGSAAFALRTSCLGVGFFMLCWACFDRPEGAVGRLFSWTPMRWLGNMSYSYYLIHGLALKIFFTALQTVVPPAAQWNAALGLAPLLPSFGFTLLVAAALYLTIERPLSLRPAAAGRAA